MYPQTSKRNVIFILRTHDLNKTHFPILGDKLLKHEKSQAFERADLRFPLFYLSLKLRASVLKYRKI